MNNTQKSKWLLMHDAAPESKICIYGAGLYGKRLYKMLTLCDISVDMFLDSNHNTWGVEVISGTPCKNPQELLPDNGNILVIVAIKNEPRTIAKNLKNLGFKNVILFSDVEQELQTEIDDYIENFGVKLVSYMADSGVGTDKCLKANCFPMQVHFYQPVPNLEDLERRDVWSKVSPMHGIKWEPETFLLNLKEISQYKPNPNWELDQQDFKLENNSFSYICASFLYGMIRMHRPKRIIEVGSGNSSKIIKRALTDNIRHKEQDISYTIIDPYCAFDEEQFEPVHPKIIKMPVEETQLSLFEQLEAGDILFIDSSHTVRIGGDVNFEILEILPILAPGVLVHFHDISLPYEYDKIYATNPASRMFWTEAYMLQAFLSHNDAYEILLPATYLCKSHLDTVKACYPGMSKPFDWSSSSFWIKRSL